MTDEDRLASLRIDRSEEPAGAGRRRWPWAVLLGVLLAAAMVGWRVVGSAAVAQVTTAVAVEGAEGRPEATVLNASGYVTARRQATVSSKVTGRVLEVLIEEGMAVSRGQLMARLDDSNARAGLALAGAQLEVARKALRETEVQLREAELTLGRTRSLVGEGVASQADLDRDEAAADSLRARLQRQASEVEAAEEEVALWRQEIEDRVIRAPFDGIVVSKNAQPGEMISPVSAGGGFTRTGIGTVVDMASLEIEVDVNESYINRVRPGQEVEAILDAYPDWRIPAGVIAIVPTADRQRATVKVRIGFEELDPRVLPDMGVKVAFREGREAGPRAPVVTVPVAAVREQGGQSLVLVVRDGVLERRAVRVATAEEGTARIAAGLAAGERVVVEGPADLAPGDRVKERQG